MANKVCDFCLSEGKGLFNQPKKIEDGHYICKDCRSILASYNLPIKHDIFQILVTAQENMRDMIMESYIKNHNIDEMMAKFYPVDDMPLHPGEHCISKVKAYQTVTKDAIPYTRAVSKIAEISKATIQNIVDSTTRTNSHKVEGILYETDVAFYFLSPNYVNCHRLGYALRNRSDTDRINVVTPTARYTYMLDNSDLIFMRERFYQKLNAARNNKDTHLIYMSDDNHIRITPGVYDIPKSLRPGKYVVTAIRDAGLHMKDSLGRVIDYYENEEVIDLSDGGVLECTGEYELKWISHK